MIFKKFRPSIGDTLKVSDLMSLRYEKIAEDIQPIWHEIPASDATKTFEEGQYVEVTPDCWFVYDHGQWRMMTGDEHVEARRHNYLYSNNPADFGQL